MREPAGQLKCVRCGDEQPQGYYPVCQNCGGLTDIHYDLDNVQLYDSSNPYTRFSDLLPVKDKSLLPQHASYTPVVHAKKLGAQIGLSKLYLKNETVSATGSTKDRMAAVALPFLYERGVRNFCTSSTGNTSTAFANAITNIPGLKIFLFTGSDFRSRVNYKSSQQVEHYILQDATFVEAFDYAAEFARQHAYTAERGFFNCGRREGLKLSLFEAVEQIDQPIDWYVQAVSSAMGVYGVFKGAKELLQLARIPYLPRLLCAQQETCAPMVKAWNAGAEEIDKSHIVANPKGIAMAILRGNPFRVYPYVRKIVKESRGDMVKSTENEIRLAQHLIKKEGIDICYSAATAVAGLIKKVNDGVVKKNQTVLINLTGKDRRAEALPDDVQYMKKIAGQWVLSTVH